MELTKRQALFLMTICLLASKVQRLPSLVASANGRHGYLVFLLLGGIDILMLLVCLLFNKLAGKQTTYLVLQKTSGAFFTKLIYILFAVYFFFNCILPYEAVHDLFANILFDHLSWPLYSLILVGSVLFVSSRGLKNIGRLSEVFFYLIIGSLLFLLIMGACTTDFHRIMPIYDIQGKVLLETCFNYNIWFGDFLIIYMFVGKTKQSDGKMGWPFIVVYIGLILLITFTYMVFYGLYENLASDQNSLISSISQFALLGLDIGRVDWFLVLFFQISTILSSSCYLYLAGYCLFEVFSSHKASQVSKEEKEHKEAKKLLIILSVLVLAIYLLDVYLFKSNHEGVAIMANITKYFGVFMVILLPIILLIIGIVYSKKRKKQDAGIKNKLFGLVFRHKKVKPTKKQAKAKITLEPLKEVEKETGE